MGDATLGEFHLERNLRDAGCPLSLIRTLAQLQKVGDTRGQLRLLARQRTTLLRKVHENQNRVDCLDHLVHTLKNRKD